MSISVENFKSQNFPTPCILRPAEETYDLELGSGAGSQKTRMMVLLGRERSLTISSAIWIQCTHVTNGQTPGDSKDRAYT